MNPRIHHPSWYRSAGIIDEDAEKNALNSDDMICSQALSNFLTAQFGINCFSTRWAVTTTKKEYCERISKVITQVFDEKLHETPLTAIGFNFEFHVVTDLTNVHEFLAKKFCETGLRLADFNTTSARFTLEERTENCRTRTRIEPSEMANGMVFVASNFEYGIDVQEGSHSYLIEPLVKPIFFNNLETAFRRTSEIVCSINESLTGVVDGH